MHPQLLVALNQLHLSRLSLETARDLGLNDVAEGEFQCQLPHDRN